jgi:hypothetical protein
MICCWCVAVQGQAHQTPGAPSAAPPSVQGQGQGQSHQSRLLLVWTEVTVDLRHSNMADTCESQLYVGNEDLFSQIAREIYNY